MPTVLKAVKVRPASPDVAHGEIVTVGNGETEGDGVADGKTHWRVAISNVKLVRPSSEAIVTELLSATTMCITPTFSGVW